MTLLDQVSSIRQQFENRTIPESVLVNLYHRYNDVEGPALFVERAKDIFPKGNCGLATVYLQEVLGGGEIIRGKYGNEPHTFLLFGEDVIDITADQYGGPEVYVGPVAVPWSTQESKMNVQ